MSEDAEIRAMQAIYSTLEDLDQDAIQRVLTWAANRFSVQGMDRSSRGSAGQEHPARSKEDDEDQEFEDLASLFVAASPGTEAEKVLVAGYWFQEIEGIDDLTSRMVNDELKHLGHQVSNITREFSNLIKKKPALAVQVRKTGSAQQAHKIYRLTKAGTQRVREMLESEAH